MPNPTYTMIMNFAVIILCDTWKMFEMLTNSLFMTVNFHNLTKCVLNVEFFAVKFEINYCV